MADVTPKIRDATIDDARCLTALGRSLYRRYFADLWSEEGFIRFVEGEFEESAIHEDILQDRARYYLFARDGETVGFAKMKRDQPIPHTDRRGTLLEKLYFHPDYVGRGWGQDVLIHLMTRARATKDEFIWLEVLRTNARARRAYEKAGFCHVGEVAFATDRQEIGFCIMSRRLT